MEAERNIGPGRRRRNEETSQAGFGLVGVDGWTGVRWVLEFHGGLSQPTGSVTLGHGDTSKIVAVCTAARNPHGDDGATFGDATGGAQNFAASRLWEFVIWDSPQDLDHGLASLYLHRSWPYAAAHARSWIDWEAADWTVDGEHLAARVFRFSGGWVGVTDGDPDRYISVAVRGAPWPTDVNLAEVEGREYGWDFSKPFKVARYRPSPVPQYVERLMSGPPATGPQHREVLSTEPEPVESTRDGKTFRLEVQSLESVESVEELSRQSPLPVWLPRPWPQSCGIPRFVGAPIPKPGLTVWGIHTSDWNARVRLWVYGREATGAVDEAVRYDLGLPGPAALGTRSITREGTPQESPVVTMYLRDVTVQLVGDGMSAQDLLDIASKLVPG